MTGVNYEICCSYCSTEISGQYYWDKDERTSLCPACYHESSKESEYFRMAKKMERDVKMGALSQHAMDDCLTRMREMYNMKEIS